MRHVNAKQTKATIRPKCLKKPRGMHVENDKIIQMGDEYGGIKNTYDRIMDDIWGNTHVL